MKKKEDKKSAKAELPKFKPQFGGKNSQFSPDREISPTQEAGAISNPNTFKTQHKG